jgi:hypothetical protein
MRAQLSTNFSSSFVPTIDLLFFFNYMMKFEYYFFVFIIVIFISLGKLLSYLHDLMIVSS